MPVELREHQHELCTLDGESVLLFGTAETGYLTTAPPAITGAEMRSGDTDMPQEDGRSFGRDYLSGKAITFEMAVLADRSAADPHRANIDRLEAFESLWLDERWRDRPDALTILRTHQAGQTWRAYGRPTRYDEITSVTTQYGASGALAEFRLRDTQWYSDFEQSVEIDLIPPASGGLTAPLVSPIMTAAKATGIRPVVISGSRPTWLAVDFMGPAVNPQVVIGDGEVVLGVDVVIDYNETVTIDTAPWARSVIRQNDGAGLAGAISPRTTLMSRSALRPGIYPIRFDAESETGTARCRVRWRDARARP